MFSTKSQSRVFVLTEISRTILTRPSRQMNSTSVRLSGIRDLAHACRNMIEFFSLSISAASNFFYRKSIFSVEDIRKVSPPNKPRPITNYFSPRLKQTFVARSHPTKLNQVWILLRDTFVTLLNKVQYYTLWASYIKSINCKLNVHKGILIGQLHSLRYDTTLGLDPIFYVSKLLRYGGYLKVEVD